MKHENFIRESLEQNLSGLHVSRQQQIDMIDEITGGRKMKRKIPFSIVLAAVLILTSVTAFAIANYYSVLDFVADGKPSAAFEEAVVPVGKTAESNGLSFTLGDAVFDGKNLMFTMNITASDGAEPVYVYPELTASHCGDPIQVFRDGFDFAYGAGAIIPSLDPQEPLVSSDRGFEVELSEPIQSGSVDWTYTLQLYKPTGKLVEVEYEWPEEGKDPIDWRELYRSLHANGEIGVLAGNSIGDYLLALAAEDEPYGALTEAERAESSGLFKLVDTVTFKFSTDASESANLIDEASFDFEGYSVTVKSVTSSFLQVNYELEVLYDEPQPSEHELEQFYSLIDQDGAVMKRREAALSLAEDKRTCTVWGSVERISDTPLTEITFVLNQESTLDPNDKAEDMPSFTIEIKK